MRENVGIGKHATESFEHLLAAAHSYQPIMDERDLQRRIAGH